MSSPAQEIRQRLREQIGLAEPENRAPRRIFFRGRYLEFPPGTSDEEIEQTLKAPASEFLHVSEARGVPAPMLADVVEYLQGIPLADFVAGGLLESLRKKALGLRGTPEEAAAAALDVFPGLGGVTRAVGPLANIPITRIRPIGNTPLYRGIINPEERAIALRSGFVRGSGSAELHTPGTSTSVDPLVSLRPGFTDIGYGTEIELAMGLLRRELSPKDIPIFRITPERRSFPVLVADVDPISYILRSKVPSAGPGVAALAKPNYLFREAEVFFRRDVPDYVQPILRASPLSKEELVRLLRDRGAIHSRIREAEELFLSQGDVEGVRYNVRDPWSKIAAGTQLLREAIVRAEPYKGTRIDATEAAAELILSVRNARGAGSEYALSDLMSIPVGKDLKFGSLVSSAREVINSVGRISNIWSLARQGHTPLHAMEIIGQVYNKEPDEVLDKVLRPMIKAQYEAYRDLRNKLRKVNLSQAVREDRGEYVREAYDAVVRAKMRRVRPRRGKAGANIRER